MMINWWWNCWDLLVKLSICKFTLLQFVGSVSFFVYFPESINCHDLGVHHNEPSALMLWNSLIHPRSFAHAPHTQFVWQCFWSWFFQAYSHLQYLLPHRLGTDQLRVPERHIVPGIEVRRQPCLEIQESKGLVSCGFTEEAGLGDLWQYCIYYCKPIRRGQTKIIYNLQGVKVDTRECGCEWVNR